MIKYRFLHKLLVIWILGWLYIGSQQILLTIDLMSAESKNDSWPPEGYVIIENAGNKIMIEEENLTKNSPKNIDSLNCDEEFFNTVEAVIKDDILLLSLLEDHNLYGIKKLKLKLLPSNSHEISGDIGFKMHNIRSYNLDSDLLNHKLPLDVYKRMGRDPYYIEVYLEAYNSKYNSVPCAETLLANINENNFSEYKKMEPYYLDNILEPFFEKYPDVLTIGEDEYIENYMSNQQKKFLTHLLPDVDEVAIALMNKTVEYSDEELKYIWTETKPKFVPRHNEIVIGLFGDVKKEDFKLLSRILKPLRIVAPELRISFSDMVEDVTLPIHLSPCNELLSEEFNDCKGKIDGTYYGWNNWIWVDSSNTGVRRAHIIIHELGHALGLDHNLCQNSVMTYAPYNKDYHYRVPDHVDLPYFTELDLMQLRILYDPVIQDLFYSRYNWSSNEQDIVDEFNLDKELIEEYKENPDEACLVRQTEWYEFAEMQNGKNY